MGSVNQSDLLGTIGAIEAGLKAVGYRLRNRCRPERRPNVFCWPNNVLVLYQEFSFSTCHSERNEVKFPPTVGTIYIVKPELLRHRPKEQAFPFKLDLSLIYRKYIIIETQSIPKSKERDTMSGYNGKILHVDLTSRTIRIEEPPGFLYRLYGGGSAMGTYYPAQTHARRSGSSRIGQHTHLLHRSANRRSRLRAEPHLQPTPNPRLPVGSATPRLAISGQRISNAPASMALSSGGKSQQPVYLWINDGEPRCAMPPTCGGRSPARWKLLFVMNLTTRRSKSCRSDPPVKRWSVLPISSI